MRKLFSTLLVATFLLAACSPVKDTVIPTDTATWDKELGPVVQKLKDEEKALFIAYIARKKLEETFDPAAKNKAEIPFGFTVGQAIEDQRAWKVEFDKNAAAAKIASEKAAKEAAALVAKIEAERAAITKQVNDAVVVTLVAKRELEPNYEAGRYSKYQQFIVGIENKSDKEIIGVSGALDFIDLFDKKVGGVNFRISEKIKPGATVKWSGGRDYNQFIDSHREVWNLDIGKFKTVFKPATVLFADGTKLTMPD